MSGSFETLSWFTPLEIMGRCSLRARLRPGRRPPGPAAAVEFHFSTIPTGYNTLLGFESRYSGTVISNGVY